MAIIRAPYKIAPDNGEYQLALTSGAMTIVAAAGPVWSCQWTSNALSCIVKSIKVRLSMVTAFTSAQTVDFGLFIARAYTIADTGGTAATLTTNNGKLDTKYPITSMADMRIGTTGVITAGTRTLDAQPTEVYNFQGIAIGYGQGVTSDFGMADDRQQIILRQNEGLVLQNIITQSSVGVMNLYVTMVWAEVPTGDVK